VAADHRASPRHRGHGLRPPRARRELGIDREALAEDEAHALGGAAKLCDQRPRLHGISPRTPDHINPEKPWPLITELRRATEGMALAEDEAHALGGAAKLCDQRPRLLGIDVVRGER